jgi:hypothetical protein
VNASQVPRGTFVTGTVPATFPVQNQSGLVLGVAQPRLSVSVTTPIGTLQQCGTTGVTTTNLTIKELVNTAFKSPASVAGDRILTELYRRTSGRRAAGEFDHLAGEPSVDAECFDIELCGQRGGECGYCSRWRDRLN